MLSAEFPGVHVLRQQLHDAQVVKRCDCGCPSIDITVNPASAPRATAARTGVVAESESRDERYTHLLLWVEDGYLSGLELAWLERPDAFPPLEHFDPPRRSDASRTNG
jgi:hypothetical protein